MARKRFSKNYSISFYFLITLLFLQAIYPYAMNYYNIGNPVWPALSNFFPAKLSNWDMVATNFTDGFLNSSISFYNLIISLYDLITMPHHINPIVIILSLFLFQRFKYVSYMPIILVLSYPFIAMFSYKFDNLINLFLIVSKSYFRKNLSG